MRTVPTKTLARLTAVLTAVVASVAAVALAVPAIGADAPPAPVLADLDPDVASDAAAAAVGSAAGGPALVRPVSVGFAPGGHFPWMAQHVIERELDLMASAGATWIRLPFGWNSIQPRRGDWNVAAFERVVRAARERGLQVLANVAYTPRWARQSSCRAGITCQPRDTAEFATFTGRLVRHFEPLGVRHYELWNEPNMAIFWAPLPDPDRYAQLLRRTRRAIDDTGRDVVLIAGALAPARDLANGRQIHPTTFLRRLFRAGVGGGFDAFSFHPYHYPAAPTVQADWHGLNGVLPELQRILRAHGANPEVWGTEYGFPTGTDATAVTRAEQADHIDDALAVWSQRSDAPLFWFNLRDRGTNPADREHNFGLLTQGWVPKPAWVAFRRAVARSSIPTQVFADARRRGGARPGAEALADAVNWDG